MSLQYIVMYLLEFSVFFTSPIIFFIHLFSRPTVRLLSGGLFDEGAYNGLKDKDGCITTEQFLAVAHGSAPKQDPSLGERGEGGREGGRVSFF